MVRIPAMLAAPIRQLPLALPEAPKSKQASAGSPDLLFQSLTSRHIFPKMLSVLHKGCLSPGYPNPMGLPWAGKLTKPLPKLATAPLVIPPRAQKHKAYAHKGLFTFSGLLSYRSTSLTRIKGTNSGDKPARFKS